MQRSEVNKHEIISDEEPINQLIMLPSNRDVILAGSADRAATGDYRELFGALQW
jgi:hypothetical protein